MVSQSIMVHVTLPFIHVYRNSLFFRLLNFRVKNIRIKIFSYKSNCTKIFLYEKFYNSRVVGIN